MAEQPWFELPPGIVDVLRPALDDVGDEMIEAVATIPAYARPLEGQLGDGIRAGVQAALRHFLAEIEAGEPVVRPDVYSALGRGEMRAGRSLESLLSAYRLGARVAWRRFAAAGVEAGLPPDVLYLLAESIFAYIDVLSAESAEGHALEQSAAAGEADLQRRRLVRMLVRDQPLDLAAVKSAAAAAGWPLPRRLAALAIAGENRAAAAARLPAGTISEAIGELTCAIIDDPDGPGRRAEIERAVAGARARAGLGTTVALGQARVSLARARAALELTPVDNEAVILAGPRTGELLLRSDPVLAAELAANRLAPLRGLSAGSRRRLEQTLRVWLAEQGRLGPVAAALGIHPQTVRYRLGRLRELFAGDLDDADGRFWLELALRAAATADRTGSEGGSGVDGGVARSARPARDQAAA